VRAAFQDADFKDLDAFFEDLYATFASKGAWRIFSDVVPTLTTLRERDVRLAIISNWDERLPGLLKDLDLDRFFERQFISFQIGFVKPDLRIFKHALDEMKIHPLEALHVGNDFEEDVKGAEAAGIRAYLLDRQQRPLSSRYMNDLGEIVVRL
jgi:putative hydrolase of the HAD superfamily